MHMLVCCPKRTILVPFRQSQHTYVDIVDKIRDSGRNVLIKDSQELYQHQPTRGT